MLYFIVIRKCCFCGIGSNVWVLVGVDWGFLSSVIIWEIEVLGEE